MAGFKISIKVKILSAILCISGFALVLFLFISYYSMKEQGEYALKASTALGHGAANKSMIALKGLTKQYIEGLVLAQSETSDRVFQQVETEVRYLNDFAETIYQKTGSFKSQKVYDADSATKNSDGLTYKLAPNVNYDQVKNEIDQLSGMIFIFRSVWLNNRKNLNSIYIGTASGIFLKYPWDRRYQKDYDPRKRDWFQQALKTRTAGWTEPYPDAASGKMMVSCYEPVFDKDKNIVAVVAADVTIKELVNIISSQIDGIGSAVLVDRKGHVIVKPGPESGTTDAKTDLENEIVYFPTDDPLLGNNLELIDIVRKMVKGKKGVGTFSVPEKGDCFISYAPVKATGWSLGLVVPIRKVVKSAMETKAEIELKTHDTDKRINFYMKNLEQKISFAFVFIVLLIIIFSLSFSRRITEPIARLVNGVQHVGKGELNQQIELMKTNDEIQDLGMAFNQMIMDLKGYIEQLRETTAAKERIESELQLAHDIQAGMLPSTFPPFPEIGEFDIFAMMTPAREVGGDLYDFFMINDEKLCFFVGDVSGKGVPAALFMMMAKTLLHGEALHDHSNAAQIMKRVNKILCKDNQECLFVTAFIALLDIKSGQLQFADAGHNPVLYYNSENNEFSYLEKKKSCALGIVEDLEFVNQSLTLKTGDKLFVYSDGVTDAVNMKDDMFSERRLRETLDNAKEKDVTAMIKMVESDVMVFTDNQAPFDDITMLAIEYKG